MNRIARGVLAASVLAFVGAPTLASAQTRCEQQAHDKKVTGTIIGGVLGALAGNAIGHGGGRTGGTIIGGVAGAAVGNNLSRTHCPDGYAEVQDPNYVAPPVYTDQAPPPRYDRSGFWADAPQSLHERIDWTQARIQRGRDNGSLTEAQARYGLHELADIREMGKSLRERDGGELSAEDRTYLQTRLDRVGQNLRWMRTENAGE